MGNDIYLNMIKESPIPCIWFSFEKDLNDTLDGIKILGFNDMLKITSNKEIYIGKSYNLNSSSLSSLYKILKSDKKARLFEFIDILDFFYEIDIITISDNTYVIWFTKKIEVDKYSKQILNKVGVYIWLKDKSGRYIYTNKPLKEYKNIQRDKIVGKKDEHVFPKEVVDGLISDDDKLLNGEHEFVKFTMFLEDRYVDGIKYIIEDDSGEILGTGGVVVDLLRENNYKDKIISDSKILNLLSDNIPDGIFVKDNDGIFRHCNKVFAQNRSLEKEDIIGKSEEDINTPSEKIEKYKNEESQIRTSKEFTISNSEYVGDDGRIKYYELLKIPFLDDYQNVGGVLGISRDISHRKEAEFEFERLRMEFFANLSHEFKTPLNLVFSSIQLIEYMIDKGEGNDKYKTYTKIIKQNGYRLLKMVNNLIDSTRLSAGCIEYNPQNYNIVEFIESICDSVQYYAKEENIDVVFDTDIEEKIMAFDLEKMERIMLNLLSNAIKYNNEEGIVEVSLNFEGEYLNIKVKDNGIGIPEDRLDDVFKLFKQVSNRITKASEGSGIGLSIVKSLVSLHSGNISVYSKKDIGSEFIVNIPVSLCEENEYEKKNAKYNKYVENIDIEFSDIYASIK